MDLTSHQDVVQINLCDDDQCTPAGASMVHAQSAAHLYLLENHPSSDMTDEQLEELSPWSESAKTVVAAIETTEAAR